MLKTRKDPSMKNRNSLFFTLIIALLVSTLAKAALLPPAEFDLQKSTVQFLAIGRPAAIKVRGEGSNLHGHLTIADNHARGQLTFDLESLDTGIALRNQHMKEKYLETNKFKTADLTIENLNIPESVYASSSPISLPFSGSLTLHGVKRPVSGVSNIQLHNNGVTGKAEFEIKLSDFQIEIPTYLGITVADLVKVNVNFDAAKKELKK
jgi:polyisoprenoid-binding protein YceI